MSTVPYVSINRVQEVPKFTPEEVKEIKLSEKFKRNIKEVKKDNEEVIKIIGKELEEVRKESK